MYSSFKLVHSMPISSSFCVVIVCRPTYIVLLLFLLSFVPLALHFQAFCVLIEKTEWRKLCLPLSKLSVNCSLLTMKRAIKLSN